VYNYTIKYEAMKNIINTSIDQQQNIQSHKNAERWQYWEKKYHLTTEQVKAALAGVGNDERLLEGFLRKNVGLNGH
jgi:hypothetical protein